MDRTVWAVSALVIFALAYFYLDGTINFEISLKSDWEQYVQKSRNERALEWQAYVDKAKNKTKSRRLPNVIGIGVKKCGTGAAISFLRHHPLVKVPPGQTQETFFFNDLYNRGLEYYKRQMPLAAGHEIVMEKTPVYFHAPPIEVANRIHRDIPGVKLILILCEPVKRIFSDYTFEWVRYNIDKTAKVVAKCPTFDSYLDSYIPLVNKTLSIGKKAMFKYHMTRYFTDHPVTLLTAGFYSLHLSRWMELFNSTRLLIVNGEEMLRNPGLQIEKMQEFIGIRKLLLKDDFVRHPNNGLYCIRPWWKDYDFESERDNKPGWYEHLVCLGKNKGRTRRSNVSINASAMHIASLRQLYAKFNQELYEMTGIDYRDDGIHSEVN